MARVFIDGFEAGQLDLWDAYSFPYGGGIRSGIPGMDGTYCCDNAGNGSYLRKVVAAASEYYCAFQLI